ncbi:hypothetical protein DFJ74DRAFT_694393 [Hyaloraphidium curvatum]|nr:hypothetical protein DFJ74DRAFT_694393 [Hyaloraphidium curvatum]
MVVRRIDIHRRESGHGAPERELLVVHVLPQEANEDEVHPGPNLTSLARILSRSEPFSVRWGLKNSTTSSPGPSRDMQRFQRHPELQRRLQILGVGLDRRQHTPERGEVVELQRQPCRPDVPHPHPDQVRRGGSRSRDAQHAVLGDAEAHGGGRGFRVGEEGGKRVLEGSGGEVGDIDPEMPREGLGGPDDGGDLEEAGVDEGRPPHTASEERVQDLGEAFVCFVRVGCLAEDRQVLQRAAPDGCSAGALPIKQPRDGLERDSPFADHHIAVQERQSGGEQRFAGQGGLGEGALAAAVREGLEHLQQQFRRQDGFVERIIGCRCPRYGGSHTLGDAREGRVGCAGRVALFTSAHRSHPTCLLYPSKRWTLPDSISACVPSSAPSQTLSATGVAGLAQAWIWLGSAEGC